MESRKLKIRKFKEISNDDFEVFYKRVTRLLFFYAFDDDDSGSEEAEELVSIQSSTKSSRRRELNGTAIEDKKLITELPSSHNAPKPKESMEVGQSPKEISQDRIFKAPQCKAFCTQLRPTLSPIKELQECREDLKELFTTQSTRNAIEEEELASALPSSLDVHAQQSTESEVDEFRKEISQDRLSTFKISLCKAFQENRNQALNLNRIKELVNKDNSSPYSQGELSAAIEKMSDDNQVMMVDGTLLLI